MFNIEEELNLGRQIFLAESANKFTEWILYYYN